MIPGSSASRVIKFMKNNKGLIGRGSDCNSYWIFKVLLSSSIRKYELLHAVGHFLQEQNSLSNLTHQNGMFPKKYQL